jgi:hypothetical protein
MEGLNQLIYVLAAVAAIAGSALVTMGEWAV